MITLMTNIESPDSFRASLSFVHSSSIFLTMLIKDLNLILYFLLYLLAELPR